MLAEERRVHPLLLRYAAIVSFALPAAVGAVYAADVVRERSEATYYCDASNVAGSGNMMLFADIGGWASSVNGSIDPSVGGQLGIGGIMQFEAQAAFPAFSTVGLAQAHLQITSPGNDRLRPFGAALSGDLYLSSTLDTLSQNTSSDKPEYNPYIRASLLADIDWLAFFGWLPLKTYLNVSLADDPGLLNRYNQLSGRVGLEWKMQRHSLFCDIGGGLYKENRNARFNPSGDQRYEQYYGWLSPGGRYRFLNRFSLVGATRILVFQNVKRRNGLMPNLFSAEIRLEAPLFYRETNTEAIRTLVFMEQEKEKKSKFVVTAGKGGMAEMEKNYLGDFGITFKETGDTAAAARLSQEEDAAKKRREEIQQKMDAIELMLKETE